MKTNRLFNSSSLTGFAFAQASSTQRTFEASRGPQHRDRLDYLQLPDERITNIVVPLDGSAFAENAIPVALGIAEQCGAVVQLVHVLVPTDILDPFGALHFPDAKLSAVKRQKRKYLADKVQQISATSLVSVSARVIDGRAVAQALNAGELGADLVVMASHRRGPIGRFWWGSVAHSLLRQISVPVLLVRGENEQVNFRPKPISHVVLPLDGDKKSENVLEPLRDLGIFAEARHTMLRVIRLVPKHVVREYALLTDWVPSRRRWVAEMQYLQHLARSLRDQSRRVHTKVISSDEPVGQVVLRYAQQADADLIAVAYHRQGPLGRVLRPSISEYLFRTANCPLLFVPVEE